MYRRLAIAAALFAAWGCEPSGPNEPLRTTRFALDAGTDAPVNTPPIAADDAVDVDEDDVVTFDVLANDVDEDGDALTVFVSDNASEGVLEDLGSGSFRYTPRSNFVGTDSFVYGVLDGHGGSAEATVTITVSGVNDPPQFISPTPPNGATLNGVVGQPFTIALVAADIDGDVLTVTIASFDAMTAATLDGEAFRWLPGPTDVGTHALSVTVTDGTEDDTRQFTITVGAAADTPCGATICTGGTVCVDGTCLPPCLTNENCTAPSLCFDGHCARDACEYRSCDDPRACELGGCFRECTFDGECRPGQRCWGTRCAETSCQDVVCDADSACVGGVCRKTCEADGDCASGSCFDGGCAEAACDDVLCPAGQQCDSGACVPEADGAEGEPRVDSGCGCSQSGPASAAWLLFGGLVLGFWRRARR